METQEDTKVRMVALINLKAMCARQSGVCHRYSVTKVTKNRVYVEYSNPDEYGNESPMTAVFPCYPSNFSDDKNNPRVILDLLRVINDNQFKDGWQNFDWLSLSGAPTLWRDLSGNWKSHKEIGSSEHDSCVVCDLEKK